MAAIMVAVCIVMIIGGSYGLRTGHEVNQPSIETRYAQSDRTTQPEQDKP